MTNHDYTDLIARLRDASSRPQRNCMGVGDYWNLCDDAADAIEALQEKNRLLADTYQRYMDNADVIGAKHEAEIDRLREELAQAKDNTKKWLEFVGFGEGGVATKESSDD